MTERDDTGTDRAAGPPGSGRPLRRAARVAGRAVRRGGPAAVAGLLAGGVALGTGHLAAAAVSPYASPFTTVGLGFIQITPGPLKDFAIETFGTHDKDALLAGMAVVIGVLALALGVLCRWRRWLGPAGFALFALAGVFAALTRPTATPAYALPSLVAGITGAVTVLVLVGALRRRTRPAVPATPAASAPPAGAGEAADAVADEAADAVADEVANGSTAAGRPEPSRRRFLLLGGAAVVVAAATAAGGAALQAGRVNVDKIRAALRLPAPKSPAPALPAGTQLKTRGLTRFYTPNETFYKIDTTLAVPQISPDEWSLRIHGAVGRERTLSYRDLVARPMIERDVTLACVSNQVGQELNGNARWLGVPLAPLLRELGVDERADQVFTTSQDGWTCGTPLRAVLHTPNAMLAVAMNGEPLPAKHGFPVRMLVPGIYGYASATKWIVDLEVTSWAKQAYWLPRGYAQQAPIKTFSRIDTPLPLAGVRRAATVPVAGIAYAPTRGIAKVEVRVDDGPWHEARLAAVPNDQTWRQWVWNWTPTSTGAHTLTVRATDGHGRTQTAKRAKPLPNGATGWDDVVVTVT